MTRDDMRLRILLRIVGVLTLMALVGVLMPRSWMASTHEWLGLGELPAAPIVENLARSVSAFYSIFGAVCLVMAADPERYRPLVRFLGVVVALFGVVLIGINLTAGMPLWWTASEAGSTMVFGALMFFLARHDERP
jgi:energy-converting hydrogenase Eha subunit E